jgi:20S proteasome subunit beta 4
LEEATQIVQKCIAELQTRFIINLPRFIVKVIDSEGIRVLPLTTPVLTAPS